MAISQSAVPPDGIAVPAPQFAHDLSLVQTVACFPVEYIIPKSGIEALDIPLMLVILVDTLHVLIPL